MVLAALKAMLEHDLFLSVVADAFPPDGFSSDGAPTDDVEA